jgi:hypothetical protein
MANGRCELHGGKSTGPRTPEGVERIRRAQTKHGHYSAKGCPAMRRAAPGGDCSPLISAATMSWALIRTQYPARRRRASALPTSWSRRPRPAPLGEPPVGFVGRLLGGVKLDSDEKPPPVIRIAHLPNAFSISLLSFGAMADAHASIDFTNSTGIRVQTSGPCQSSLSPAA